MNYSHIKKNPELQMRNMGAIPQEKSIFVEATPI